MPKERPFVYHAIPTYNRTTVDWALSTMGIGRPVGSKIHHAPEKTPPDIEGGDIASKRNRLVEDSLARGSVLTLFQSDDVSLPRNFLLQGWKRIQQGAKIVVGVYWTKRHPALPMIWKDYQAPFLDWYMGDFFKILWTGCDAMLIHNDVLKKIPPPWFDIHYQTNAPDDIAEIPGTEDIPFWDKVRSHGFDIWCDTALQCLHTDRETGENFGLPVGYPQANPGSMIPEPKPDYLIADLGCGKWDNPAGQRGKLVRFDLDESCLPDVVADVRLLNTEENNKYNEINAFHILEHLGRHHEVFALREWIRILKPGGILEIRVPNIRYLLDKANENNFESLFETMIIGDQLSENGYHRGVFTPEKLERIAKDAGGLTDIKIHINEGTDARPEPGAEIVLLANKLKKTQVRNVNINDKIEHKPRGIDKTLGEPDPDPVEEPEKELEKTE